MPRDCPDCGSPLGLKAVKCRCGWAAPRVAVPVENNYAERKVASLRNANVSRRSDSPLVQEIRTAYQGSRAAHEKLSGHISEKLPRVPGQDDEEMAA